MIKVTEKKGLLKKKEKKNQGCEIVAKGFFSCSWFFPPSFSISFLKDTANAKDFQVEQKAQIHSSASRESENVLKLQRKEILLDIKMSPHHLWPLQGHRFTL